MKWLARRAGDVFFGTLLYVSHVYTVIRYRERIWEDR